MRQALKVHKWAVVALAVWHEGKAEELLRGTLRRVAAQFRPEWGERYRADGRWLEPQARIEAAFLTRDMPGLRAALAAYEIHVRTVFAEYARGDGEGA